MTAHTPFQSRSEEMGEKNKKKHNKEGISGVFGSSLQPTVKLNF